MPEKSTTVTVLPADGRGGQKDHLHCAVADACKRQFKLDGAIVARTSIYLVKGKTATRYRASNEIKEEILAFDRSGIFSPGTYRLSKPEPSRLRPYEPPHKRNEKNVGKVRRNRRKILGVRAPI